MAQPSIDYYYYYHLFRLSVYIKRKEHIQHISYSNQSVHTFKQITNLMVVKSKWFPTPFYSPLILIWHFIIHSSPGIMLDSLYCVCILCLIILWGLSISSDIERSYSSWILSRLRLLGERQFSTANIFKTYCRCLFIISLHHVLNEFNNLHLRICFTWSSPLSWSRYQVCVL